ncbi:ALG9 [Candida oxycetoniae]|uniref:Mannosyltransferase n=1 Tax=Candida oxycetoniae TaxID=497107 RepID=A0AAI9WWI2_9ASCO|nr:ALG9 [Candida oxycetoniae]KAI3402769.2 ALG9 [Candida oxycetoniae]
MIIGDCDETFNYWEPLNLLLRHFGKQTWEYSPEYSIRSYAYLIPYYIIGNVAQLVKLKPVEIFYLIRIVGIAGVTSFCELKFFITMNQFSSDVANWWLVLSSVSPGMSHGGVALLPSTLALQCTLLANTYILKATKDVNSRRLEQNLLKAIGCYFVGGILGWPFVLSLGVPVGVYTIGQIANKSIKTVVLLKIALICLFVMAPVVLIDSYFLQKFVFVPINIVLYNVFGGEGEGPDIFGVEPWTYYFVNLILNFHLVFPLCIAGILFNPILCNFKTFSLFVSAQLLIWYTIFFSQPHKEERFMYPVYSLISMSASLFISKFFTTIEKRKISRPFYLSIKLVFVMGLIILSSLRIFNLVENYAAPLKTFNAIAQLEPSLNSQVNVCIGKEWYHFPNSFYLPDGYRLKFVDSGFDGLLPGDFYESGSIIDSTTYIPPQMNNRNQFESDKIIGLQECDYFIENSQSNSQPQILNPDLSTNGDWEILQCDKILNPNGKHSFLGKVLKTPKFLETLIPNKVEYMEFCALKKATAPLLSRAS